MRDFKFKKEFATPIKTTFYGDFDIDLARPAVVLNSRQTKTPCGNDPWVEGTIKAVRQVISWNMTLLTGIGMNTWELTLWACGHYGGNQIVIYPVRESDEIDRIIAGISRDFGLDSARTGWLFFEAAAKARSLKIDWPVRDRLALHFAKTILPISIRPSGNLEKLINSSKNSEIIDDFRVKYKESNRHENIKLDDIKITMPRKNWDYIVHWTRTCHGPWPQESSASFYENLVGSGDKYPHSGLETLKNILKMKKIYASSQNLREGLSAVAFSGLHPNDVLPLMRWRKRYVRWNFEPYGIAISRKSAITGGIQPVIYGKPELYKMLVDNDKPYFQSEGVDGGDWREENEWRYLSDFDLSAIAPEEMVIIVYRPSEIAALKEITDSKILSFI
jgi:hypothetical protein